MRNRYETPLGRIECYLRVKHYLVNISFKHLPHFTMNQSIAKILTFQIERGNVDGTNRMILVNHLSYPWGLAVHGPFLYYSDEEYEVIERVDKATGANKVVLRNNLPDLRGLKIYQRRGEYLSLKHTFMCVQ